MEHSELWLDRGKALFTRVRDRLMAPPAAVQSSVWYSGLGIEPADFTEQLARLQSSLAAANQTVAGSVTVRR